MRRLFLQRFFLPLFATATVFGAGAQAFHDGDIRWPSATEFAKNVSKWKSDHFLTSDDNFFISRVRPRLRFRNVATQVNPDLVEGVNDKRLCAWLPINVIKSDGKRNSLPTGEFDSECFTMWSYVDHWGNWSAPLGAIPGNFTDVAHKNGVSVSSVASIPFGLISGEWSASLNEIAALDAADVAEMLVYYGADGIGYNSEFSGYSKTKLASLREMHGALTARLNELYSKVTPGYNMAENLWYDGTSVDGEILFDQGLASHNVDNWGAKGEERTSLFFNYNWNNDERLRRTVENAATLAGGRSPLYLYCGVNMQGGEPRMTKPTWSVMKDYPVSIGLWGAHSENMFWQSRTDKGQSDASRQQTYQSRLEQWFSGGRHNPADLPEITTATRCDTDDATFHGMATFMSARSALKWDLAEAPFITCFNVGNGTFFNWAGERANDNEWYNIGIQDYMPTWRWWIADNLLGRDASERVKDINPSFTWSDARLGGSCLRIAGGA
ncbi:MAG: endo-beta-N-acetylglucosaminidase, partial [Muribaculaceae bacterium]|nr:endo-beta-N-acetylglucosaminidase [Muribaculaceae bacterium]